MAMLISLRNSKFFFRQLLSALEQNGGGIDGPSPCGRAEVLGRGLLLTDKLSLLLYDGPVCFVASGG
jgi:hypothetical protein